MVDGNAGIDRSLAVRDAIVDVVAQRGLEATTMAAVAVQAGVATGTAYVHYPSKDELLLGGYVHVKQQLGAAATRGLTEDLALHERFDRVWNQAYQHLRRHPQHARFLVQFEHSSLGAAAHARMAGETDPLAEATAPLLQVLVPLPPTVLYDLALGPVVRLVASGLRVDAPAIEQLRDACWRAVALPD